MNLDDIEFRTLDYSNESEVRSYLRLFWDIPLEHNDYFIRRTDSFVDDWMQSARKTEDASNTFPGIALYGAETVGVHIARRFEEWEQVGVSYRRSLGSPFVSRAGHCPGAEGKRGKVGTIGWCNVHEHERSG